MSEAAETSDFIPRRAIEEIQRGLGLTVDDIARSLSVDIRTVARWSGGRANPRHGTWAQLSVLLDLCHRVQEFFATPEDGRHWMNAPSRYLSGLTPADAVRVGHPERARAALEVLAEGMFV